MNISVTILTKNSSKYLLRVLEALRSFDEVLLYDNGSADDTLEVAATFSNVTIHQGAFFGFGPTHNHASSLARNDWILSIDSDEIVTSELVNEVAALSLDEGCVYAIARRNIYNGKHIRWCGWHPDRQLRLYNRKVTQFSQAQVHEGVETAGLRVVALKHPLTHYSYGCLSDFLSKMQSYSDLFAKQHVGKKGSSLFKAVMHSFFAFFKSYIIKRGIFGGREGFIISVYNSHTAFYKYLKLQEANAKEIT